MHLINVLAASLLAALSSATPIAREETPAFGTPGSNCTAGDWPVPYDMFEDKDSYPLYWSFETDPGLNFHREHSGRPDWLPRGTMQAWVVSANGESGISGPVKARASVPVCLSIGAPYYVNALAGGREHSLPKNAKVSLDVDGVYVLDHYKICEGEQHCTNWYYQMTKNDVDPDYGEHILTGNMRDWNQFPGERNWNDPTVGIFRTLTVEVEWDSLESAQADNSVYISQVWLKHFTGYVGW